MSKTMISKYRGWSSGLREFSCWLLHGNWTNSWPLNKFSNTEKSRTVKIRADPTLNNVIDSRLCIRIVSIVLQVPIPTVSLFSLEIDPPTAARACEAPAGSCCVRKARLPLWVSRTPRITSICVSHCQMLIQQNGEIPSELGSSGFCHSGLHDENVFSFRRETKGIYKDPYLNGSTNVNTCQDGIQIQHDGCVGHSWHMQNCDNCAHMNVFACFCFAK